MDFKKKIVSPLTNILTGVQFNDGHYKGYFTNYEMKEYHQDVQPSIKMAVYRYTFLVEGKFQYQTRVKNFNAKFICNGTQKVTYRFNYDLNMRNYIQCHVYAKNWFAQALFNIFKKSLVDIVQDKLDETLKFTLHSNFNVLH